MPNIINKNIESNTKQTNITFYLFLFYLALLSMLGFIATDMYLPSFKSIEGTFNASTSEVAISLTSFLAGLAIGQLLYGPLVHKIGKRNSLIVGLSLFMLASALIATSESMMMMNIARFFQAIGACSAAVIWQAIVIEQFPADKAQNIFANIMPLVALSPALAPIAGAVILNSFGWRAVFISLCIIAMILIVMTYIFVPKERASLHKSKTPIRYQQLLANTRYLGNVIIFGACSGAFFAYLTLWPAVMEQYGYAATEIGLSFIPQTIMFIVGGYSSKLLIRKFGTKISLNCLLILFGFCVTAIFISSVILDTATILPLLIAFSLLAGCNGAIYPIVVNNALQQFSHNASKAAGLQNFIQISIAFGASSLVAVWASAGDNAIGWGILACSILVAVGQFIKSHDSWVQINHYFTFPDPARLSQAFTKHDQ
ncbi:purine nucleoside transporter PunC [Shewanella livingstonensis]|uniref:Bcr/CflA family efflux transporter n=1 Tax=Shewanella livingstonensis TaxID=150120 RepID=A0A3G8LUQ6_9GAMM|nr:purine nucleoside transporter PunC [Shewanella livingstonensis]AZG72418.1 Bcr/CflA family multidrug efflux MFS transporter [Shewanella livingstonensis]